MANAFRYVTDRSAIKAADRRPHRRHDDAVANEIAIDARKRALMKRHLRGRITFRRLVMELRRLRELQQLAA